MIILRYASGGQILKADIHAKTEEGLSGLSEFLPSAHEQDQEAVQLNLATRDGNKPK